MKKLLALTLVLALIFGASTAALAAWRVSGIGTVAAAAGKLVAPPAPSAERQTGSPTTVDLAWTAVPAATSYAVHRFSDETSTTGGVHVCSTATTGCIDVNASVDSAYWYRLVVIRSAWFSPISNASHISPSAVTPMSSSISATVTRRGSSQNWSSVATVTVTDELGSSVHGALVTYQWNGGASQTCTTDAAGHCQSVDSGNTTASSQTFSVADVNKAGMAWTGLVDTLHVPKNF